MRWSKNPEIYVGVGISMLPFRPESDLKLIQLNVQYQMGTLLLSAEKGLDTNGANLSKLFH